MTSQVLRLPPLPTIRDIVKLYRLQARKQLSQNFLMDEHLTNKIVKQAGKLQNNQVIEVGPGPGSITRSIIKKLPKKLIVVEKDRRFAPTLEMLGEAFASVNGSMEIIYDDIVRTNLVPLIPEDEKRNWEDGCPNIVIIGNLPFSVSTHLIIKWLQAISEQSGLWSFGRSRMVLTFQKEVAERLIADVGQKNRCRLSVMAQAWTQPQLRFLIPGTAFVPKPEVDVGIVSFVPLVKPRTHHNFKLFEKITRHVFSFRQKYSQACVATLFPPECAAQLTKMMFKLSDLNPHMRPFELSVEDIHRLCSAYVYLLEKHPEIKDYNNRESKRVLSRRFLRNVSVEDIIDDDDPSNDCSEPVPDHYLSEAAV